MRIKMKLEPLPRRVRGAGSADRPAVPASGGACRRPRSRLWSAALLLLLGCEPAPPPAAADLAIAGPDLTTGCTGDRDCPEGMVCRDRICAATSRPDLAVPDLAAPDLGGGCRSDRDCADPGAPRCDEDSGHCASCLPKNDNCPAGKYCARTNNTWSCLPGCRSDVECHDLDGAVGAGTCCRSICVDTGADNLNCGLCGNACAVGQACCGSTCVAITNSPRHCGGCNQPCMPVNAVGGCANGRCALQKCNDGFGDCDGAAANGCEVALGNDLKSCGRCGRACAFAHGAATCKAGSCQLGACDPGFADCNQQPDDGCEVDLKGDAAHCGACGMACPKIGGAAIGCHAGKCAVDYCLGLALDCSGGAVDGCEIDGGRDPAHCGACGRACPAVANGKAGCSGGQCLVGGCNGAFRDCNGSVGDGCETDTAKDLRHCGACGKVCPTAPGAAATCVGGICGLTCTAGFADCDKSPANGCEVALGSNPRHCGACGKVCPAMGPSTATCTNGVCGTAPCGNRFKDCNATPTDGCESNTSTDPRHCGGCGKSCPVPANAAASCTMGACGLGPCTVPFRDCRNGAMDGCETDVSRDPQSCGACNSRCTVANGVAGCANFACTIASCNGTYRDCRNGYSDGCETNVANDVNHCGGCYGRCPPIHNGTPACVNSACVVGTCEAPYQSCDNDLKNGCESNRLTDPKHCGACGNVCLSGRCEGGLCKTRVLVVGAPSTDAWNNDVVTKLQGAGLFTGVDGYNAKNGTPTVVELGAYDAVLVYADAELKDAKALGDNLADYFDQGGRVVTAVFANVDAQRLRGRWESGNYFLIRPGPQEMPNEQAALQLVEPTSPLVAGVTQLRATAGFKSPGTLANGGVAVARWGTSARNLIVRGMKNGRPRVELNFFPPSSTVRGEFWSGDGARILANALLYRGHCHAIVAKAGGICPSGRVEYCDLAAPLVATSETQAKAACDACYGLSCFRETSDCSGVAYGPKPTGQFVCGNAYFGAAVGCGGGAGRIFAMCSSQVTYGRWAN